MMTALIRSFVALLAMLAGPAFAQPVYPSQPVKIIVPLPPGGAADILARATGQKLSELLGQPFIIDNRPGGGTNIGPAFVSKAPADGYTLLLGSITNHAVAVNLYANPGYDLDKSFTPIALIANAPHVLLTHPSVPAKSMQELVALAKRRPGELNFGSQGSGTLAHLEIELLHKLTGASFNHVPYKGSAPAKQDLVAGNIQLLFDSYASSSSMIKEGRMRLIAIASSARSALIPDVPTIMEAGVENFAANNWYGLLAPAGTPRSVIERLGEAMQKVLTMPDIRERLQALGLDVTPGDGERLSSVIRSDLSTWGPLVKQTGIKVE